MSIEENKVLVRRFMEEVLNGHNLDALGQFMAEDVLDHDQMPGLAPGLEGQRQMLSMLLNAFPDQHHTPELVVAEDDKVVVYSTLRGTHTGEFMGMPPTGRQVAVPGVDIVRIANGKIVEHWGVSDTLGMMMQLNPSALPS